MKTSRLSLKFPQGRSFEIEATFTDAACVVVHPTVHWEQDANEPTLLEADWTISQYPTGYKLFDGIPSKEGAILCANKHLAIKAFIGMSVSEFYKDYRVPNMSADEIKESENAIVMAYQYILNLRARLKP